MKKIFALLFSSLIFSATAQVGDGHPRGLRGAAPLDKEVATPLMPKMINAEPSKPVMIRCVRLLYFLRADVTKEWCYGLRRIFSSTREVQR